MKRVILFITLLNYLSCPAQLNELKTSQIIDSIWIGPKLKESFAIYLPATFDPSIPSSVVFIFEPMARGRTGIKPFISSSERYGYILICSNNSKNGPFDQNFEIADRLFKYIFANFNMDKERIYTAGFSGGARLASTIAVVSDQIQGVVACGAGFSMDSGHLPSIETFSFAAIIGDEDMNYEELLNTKEYLDRINFSNELFRNHSIHKWPSTKQVEIAFDWLQLEAYKKGLVTIKTPLIYSIYNNWYLNTSQNERDGSLLIAADGYQRILDNFSTYYNLDSIQQKLNLLRQDKKYKSVLKEFHLALDVEKELTQVFMDRFGSDLDKANRKLNWWVEGINRLKKKQSRGNDQEIKMYNRLLYKVFANAIESVRYSSRIDSINRNMFCYDICILIYPEYAQAYLNQMEYAIFLDNEELALDYLEKLIRSGYTDKQTIYTVKSIETLKKKGRFMDLMYEMNELNLN